MKTFVKILMGIVAMTFAFASGGALAATECNGPLSGNVVGGVVVNAGDVCMLGGANVLGPVVVNSGGVLVACGSVLKGGIDANGAAGVIIGAEEIDCDGTFISGGVRISNTGPGFFPAPAPSIAVERSVISGGVRLSGNAGMIAVATNTISGGLFCSGNTFDLDDEGSPSVVVGPVRCAFEEEEAHAH